MLHRVVLLHADPVVRPRYEAALRAVLPEGDELSFEIVNSNLPGLSAAYVGLMKRDGLDAIDPEVEDDGDVVDTFTLAAFSAGYGYARLMEVHHPDMIDALCYIDSRHSNLDSDGTAGDVDLGSLVQFALRAQEREKVLYVGHTDVPTQGYASTTQVAHELARLTGYSETRPGDTYVIREHDLVDEKVEGWRGYAREHSWALTKWGPEFLAECFGAMLAKLDRPEPLILEEQAPLGMRALPIAITQLGVDETTKKGRELVKRYHAGAMRKGQRIGGYLDHRHEWCASFFSWCMSQALLEGEQAPHDYRCSVRELWLDALRLGTARGISRVLSGEHVPQPGDGLIMTRGGDRFSEDENAFAKSRGLGHVGRIEGVHKDSRGLPVSVDTVDGNKGETVKRMTYHLDDPRMVGVIAYPQSDRLDAWVPTDAELEGAIRLSETTYLLRQGI